MTCTKCKATIPENSLYCNLCGAKQAQNPHARKPKSRGNGQGSIYREVAPSGRVRYRAIVTLGYVPNLDGSVTRRTYSRTFEKRKDAVHALPEMLANRGMCARKAPTLTELYDKYTSGREYAALSDSQKCKLGYAWNKLLPLHLRKIDSLTVADMQAVIDAATETYYPARDIKVLLSHLFELAIKAEYVENNKTEWIDLPPKENKPPEAFSDTELQCLWNDYYDTNDDITAYILIMIYSGMRFGELYSMRKTDIYLDVPFPYMVGGEKTAAGRNREMPIASKILPLVRAAYLRNKNKLLEMTEDKFRSLYWKKIDGLGIRHLPPQTCRHTYFSRLTAAGVAPGVIAKTGGHTDYKTTLKHYVKLSIAEKYSAVENI